MPRSESLDLSLNYLVLADVIGQSGVRKFSECWLKCTHVCFTVFGCVWHEVVWKWL